MMRMYQESNFLVQECFEAIVEMVGEWVVVVEVSFSGTHTVPTLFP